jgi:hypothetical protein
MEQKVGVGVSVGVGGRLACFDGSIAEGQDRKKPTLLVSRPRASSAVIVVWCKGKHELRLLNVGRRAFRSLKQDVLHLPPPGFVFTASRSSKDNHQVSSSFPHRP